VDDVFIKVETDAGRASAELAALKAGVVPVPDVLWSRHGPPALLALAKVDGEQLAEYGPPSPFGPAAWRAAGAIARKLHDVDPPEGPSPFVPGRLLQVADHECGWLVENDFVPKDVADRHAAFVHSVLDERRPTLTFVHGDLQPAHIFIGRDNQVTGVIDWGDAGPGDPLYDLAVLTVGHSEHLNDVVEGYGEPVDTEVIRAYGLARRLAAVRWRVEHGYGVADDVSVLLG
jgi:aminoglycoside phosphotransferase (APT) family kinase protein